MCVISCKIDEELKKEAERIFSQLGLNMSTAINMFLRASVRENGLPISTHLSPYESLLHKRLEESNNSENLSPIFDSFNDAKEWLDA